MSLIPLLTRVSLSSGCADTMRCEAVLAEAAAICDLVAYDAAEQPAALEPAGVRVFDLSSAIFILQVVAPVGEPERKVALTVR